MPRTRRFWQQCSDDRGPFNGHARQGEQVVTGADDAPNLLMAPGFLGRWGCLSAPRACVSISYRDLGAADPFARLAELCADRRPGEVVAGYLAYEAAVCTEPGLVLPPPPDEAGGALPAVWLGLFARAEAADPPRGGAGPSLVPRAAANVAGEAAFAAGVEEIREAIRAGDVFQANLSRRLTADAQAGGADAVDDALFARLIGGTDAPYAARLHLPGGSVLSASPELFLRTEGRTVTAEPIKGTAPRGETPGADAALAAALSASEKDRAENVMIADLLRNDLAKACEDASIRVPDLCALRTLPNVHHLVTRVTGRLREGAGFADALRGAFPCGSITGAPKRAAMEVIARLEGEGRGPYCGAILAVTDERAVASVPIRTGVWSQGVLSVRAGGGITVLSDPEAELSETRDKAYPFGLMVAG